MNEANDILVAIGPVVILLALGGLAVIVSRQLKLSPIVGYLVLGVALRATGNGILVASSVVDTLAQLGIMFLLFDVGLHFSFSHMRDQLKNILIFGPLQLGLGTVGMGLIALLFRIPLGVALFLGATLALSSTAVVARLIAERHQRSCPVGVTATAILIFQDMAALFLLVVVAALNSGSSLAPELFLVSLKAAGAFVIAIVLSKAVVTPLFQLIARSQNEEVFTATALFVALAAGWASGAVGLSLTLGAFLGGMILSETPYRAIIESEIKPFRGLLLSFFFISVGLSLDPGMIAARWPSIVGVAALIVVAKVILNAVASLAFRWSVPGSIQIGFLLAQGSELAFVIFRLPTVRQLVGPDTTVVLIGSVALTLAATPAIADVGRTLAGKLRQRANIKHEAELVPLHVTAVVLIAGMGRRGRTLADSLTEFGIPYAAIEGNELLLQNAIADGYMVFFGDIGDPRIWQPISLGRSKLCVITEPSYEAAAEVTTVVTRLHPGLRIMAAVDDDAEAQRFSLIGIEPAVDRRGDGVDLASMVLGEFGAKKEAIDLWSRKLRYLNAEEEKEAAAA